MKTIIEFLKDQVSTEWGIFEIYLWIVSAICAAISFSMFLWGVG